MPDERYLVAARKYRPKRFSELVAQEHVTDTLKNALRLDRLAHAYLFSGPRGVGKTTAARILAKAINCETPLSERADEAEPCRQCPSCEAFEAGRSLNIIELDAASNNKVDDIRELRETVRIPPQGSKKKVYIIDEVHMLSNQAFNALLKTLEEPPPHVLFIFATTEPHKVLPTILSRCQRFDFRRIPVVDIVERLREICEKEDITADEESLMLLARKGDGALRDALSAFDQAVSLCGTDLRYTELTQAMGVVDLDLFFQLTDHVREGNSAGMLELVEAIVRAGYDLQEFLTGLAEHLRNLLVAATMDDLRLIEAAQATRSRYAKAAEAFSEADLLRLLMIAGQAEDEITSSSQPRLKLELALLKMASLPRAVDLQEALNRLDCLEQLAEEGKLPSRLPSSASDEPDEPSGSANGAPPTHEEKEKATPPQKEERSSAASSDDPGHSAREEDSEATPDEPPPPRAEAPEPKPFAPAREEPEQTEQEKTPPRKGSGYTDLFGKPALKKKKQQERPSEDEAPGPAQNTAPETATAAAPPPSDAHSPEDASTAGRFQEAWPELVKAVGKKRIRVGSCLQHATPRHVAAGTAVVAVPDDFHRRLLREHQAFLLKHLPEAAPDIEQFRFVIDEGASNPPGETADEIDPYEALEAMREEHPVVRALFEKFGGEFVYR